MKKENEFLDFFIIVVMILLSITIIYQSITINKYAGHIRHQHKIIIEEDKLLAEIDSLIRKKIEWYENERRELYKQIEESNGYLLKSLDLMEKTHKMNEGVIGTYSSILSWGSK